MQSSFIVILLTNNTAIMQEVWKDIKGYEGYYQVSNLGRVKSLSRVVKRYEKGRGEVIQRRRERILSERDCRGYKTVLLCVGGSNKQKFIHRLVAEVFLDSVEGKDYVNHIDNDPSNNCSINLEWCTAKENAHHMIKQGRKACVKGENHPCRKLTEKQVRQIRREYKQGGVTQQQLASKYGVSRSNIGYIVRGVLWLFDVVK